MVSGHCKQVLDVPVPYAASEEAKVRAAVQRRWSPDLGRLRRPLNNWNAWECAPSQETTAESAESSTIQTVARQVARVRRLWIWLELMLLNGHKGVTRTYNETQKLHLNPLQLEGSHNIREEACVRNHASQGPQEFWGARRERLAGRFKHLCVQLLVGNLFA